MQFKKAIKYAAKGRVALIGPAGSGKSFTGLILATALAAGKRIAAIDTEHGSLSKYADLYEFDVIEMDSYSPQNFLAALHLAEKEGYGAFLCDSLSHFWVGKDGALEFVDNANARNFNKMDGWKAFRPHEREMVDAMLASPCHIICTMRTKTDYQEVTDEKGKKKRIKIGLAPVQRDGMEYEFDLVGYMEDGTLNIDKTRCSHYSDKSVRKPDAKAFAPFVEWLQGEARPQQSGKPAPDPAPGPSFPDEPKIVADWTKRIDGLLTLDDFNKVLLDMQGIGQKVSDQGKALLQSTLKKQATANGFVYHKDARAFVVMGDAA